MQATTSQILLAAAEADAAIATAQHSAAFACVQLGLLGHFKRAAERALALSDQARAEGDSATAWAFLVSAAGYQEQAERAACYVAATSEANA